MPAGAKPGAWSRSISISRIPYGFRLPIIRELPSSGRAGVRMQAISSDLVVTLAGLSRAIIAGKLWIVEPDRIREYTADASEQSQ
jgi:hypothetical protein